MPTYSDGPWSSISVTLTFQSSAPTVGDGPWSSINTNVPKRIPLGDGPWESIGVTLFPNFSAHRPLIVKRSGVLTRIRIFTLEDILPIPIRIFREDRVASESKPVTVVFAGSSSTQGTGASTTANRYVNRLIAAMQAANPNGSTESTVVASASATFTKKTTPGIHGYNLGEGGTTAINFFTESERTNVAAMAPDAVFIMIGSNDQAFNMNPSTTYKNNLSAVLSDLRAKSPGTMFFLVHSYERMDGTYTYPWSAYRTALQDLSAASPSDTAFIDASLPFITQGVPGTDPNNLVGTDNIHPTDAGHLLLAQTIYSKL